jgi:hypothetical protein
MNDTIYCDESGNTGAALLDPAQPAFALASNNFNVEEAKELMALVQSNAAEPKFSSLKASAKGVEKLVAFLKHELLTPDRVVLTVDHKEYMVVAKIIDVLVEHMAHRDGINLRERGGNIAEANLLFYSTRVFSDKKAFDAMLTNFVTMIRRPGKESIDRFYYWAGRVFRSLGERASLVAPILYSRQEIGPILELNGPTSIDPAVTNVVHHCHEWGQRLPDGFDVVHDQSKPVYADRAVFAAFMDKSVEPRLIGTDRRKFYFPLRARSLTFGASHEIPQLQISDLIAGAAMHLAAVRITKSNSELAKQLDQAGLERLLTHVLWPSPEVDPRKLGTEQKGGIDSVDYITEFMMKREATKGT